MNLPAKIYQVEMIGRGSLSVMAKPESGELINDEFANIARLGINRIVSLLEEQESMEFGLSKESELADNNGMDFVSFPVADFGLPGSVAQFSKFTKRLYHDAAGGLHTVVHCRAGIGRSGVVAAGILLHCGFEPFEAFHHVSNKRGVPVPDTQEQIQWIKNNYGAIVSG